MTIDAYIIGAKRSPVAPRGGDLSSVPAHELMSPIITTLLNDANITAEAVDCVILGNALYAGGNPARLAALHAGLPETTPATTIDTQCCAGMDAIALAKTMVRAGDCDIVLAGGLESYSFAPRRLARGKTKDDDWKYYNRPPFTPWADRDPDMIDAAALLAKMNKISRKQQEEFAIHSHQKALKSADKMTMEIVPIKGVFCDQFTRKLTSATCARLPAITGVQNYALTSATIAVEADGAALCLVVSPKIMKKYNEFIAHALCIRHARSLGSDPQMPALAPVAVSKAVLSDMELSPKKLDVCEVMEAFSSQAIQCINEIGLNPDKVNLTGGGLARGHPIGASGAINIVRLFHEIRCDQQARIGLATIAGAGGLGSAMVLGK